MPTLKLLLLALMTLVFASLPFKASASPTTQNETPSFYNDKSWHGGWNFAQLIAASGATLSYHRDNATMEAQTQGEILVLIAPELNHFKKADFDAALDNGYRMLIFDNSMASIDWLKEISPNLRFSQGQDPEAAHINANPMLPVWTTTQAFGALPAAKRLAFNHPQALAGGHPFVGNSRFGYAFIYPKFTADELRNSQAPFALIFRDESLPSTLMLEKLDNRSFFSESFRMLCPKTGLCRFHLFEPNMTPVFKPSQGILASIPRRIESTILELIEQIKHIYRQNQAAIDAFPWQAIGIAFILFWTFLATLMAYPLTRD